MQPITENKHVDWRPSSQSENDIWFRRTTLPHFYASNEGPVGANGGPSSKVSLIKISDFNLGTIKPA